jgi:hypothetical protein
MASTHENQQVRAINLDRFGQHSVYAGGQAERLHGWQTPERDVLAGRKDTVDAESCMHGLF